MIKLHLGCGAVNLGDDWIHIDSENHPHVEYNDVTKLPFNDGEVSRIYASHVLSYFNADKGLKVLKEWARVLSGKMWIAVPDFQAMAKLYTSGGWPIEDFLGPLYGKMQDSTAINSHPVMTTNTLLPIYHKTCYDERSLSKALHRAGFNLIIKPTIYDDWPFRYDQSQAYLPDRNPQGTLISLNLHAYK